MMNFEFFRTRRRPVRPTSAVAVFSVTMLLCLGAQAQCPPCEVGHCSADLTGSGVVGVPDLLALLSTWGPCPTGCPGPPECPGDHTCSGAVGVPSLLGLLSQWGECPPPPKGASCAGMCNEFVDPADGCSCDPYCFDDNNCCFDVCETCDICQGACCVDGFGCFTTTQLICEFGDEVPGVFFGGGSVCGEVPCGIPGSCLGHCSATGPGDCLCDEFCVEVGDCCPDACELCGHCPGACCNPGINEPCFITTATGCAIAGGEYAGSFTTCADCGAAGSCADHCGGEAPGNCWCDAACVEQGDCCDDACAVCNHCRGACCSPDLGGECVIMSHEECAFNDGAWDEGVESCIGYVCGGTASCAGHCGGQAPGNGGCWCDETCCAFLDCCDDKCDACGTAHGNCDNDDICGLSPNSCAGVCGGTVSGLCHCDVACCFLLDCCADKCTLCAGSHGDCDNSGPCGGFNPNSCAGSCGGYTGKCYCDEDCCAFMDCCANKAAVCGGCSP